MKEDVHKLTPAGVANPNQKSNIEPGQPLSCLMQFQYSYQPFLKLFLHFVALWVSYESITNIKLIHQSIRQKAASLFYFDAVHLFPAQISLHCGGLKCRCQKIAPSCIEKMTCHQNTYCSSSGSKFNP